jgi:hypothetical protein
VWEQKRAWQLWPLLKASRFFLDLHQTILPSAKPFFVFPFSQGGVTWARYLSPQTPLVTHRPAWGQGSFSQEGLCSDEAVLGLGGCGITLELGQCGFASGPILFGVHVLHKAHLGVYAPHLASDEGLCSDEGEPVLCGGQMYTWAETVLTAGYDNEPGPLGLIPGLFNFKSIQAGSLLAHYPSGKPFYAPQSGPVLFPKYPEPGQRMPKELCRILRLALPGEF